MLNYEAFRARLTLFWTFVASATIFALVIVVVALFPQAHIARQDSAALLVVAWSAALVTAIISSFLGCSLALENCHLELVGTRPVSRLRYAAGVIVVDLLCLLAVFAIVLTCAYGVATVLQGAPPYITFDQNTALKLARFMLFPLAMFGLAQSLTAGIRANATIGWTIGLTWPIAQALSFLAVLPLVAPWHTLFSALNLVNPIGYFPLWEFDDGNPLGGGARPYFGYGLVIDALALLAIVMIGTSVAAARWRRMEA